MESSQSVSNAWKLTVSGHTIETIPCNYNWHVSLSASVGHTTQNSFRCLNVLQLSFISGFSAMNFTYKFLIESFRKRFCCLFFFFVTVFSCSHAAHVITDQEFFNPVAVSGTCILFLWTNSLPCNSFRQRFAEKPNFRWVVVFNLYFLIMLPVISRQYICFFLSSDVFLYFDLMLSTTAWWKIRVYEFLLKLHGVITCASLFLVCLWACFYFFMLQMLFVLFCKMCILFHLVFSFLQFIFHSGFLLPLLSSCL